MKTVICEQPGCADPEFHKRETTRLASRNATVAGFETVLDAPRAKKIPTAVLNAHVSERGSLRDEIPRLPDPSAGVIKALAAC